MKKTLIVVSILILALSACTPQPAPAAEMPEMMGVAKVTNAEELLLFFDSDTQVFLTACAEELAYTGQSVDWLVAHCASTYEYSYVEMTVGELTPLMGEVFPVGIAMKPQLTIPMVMAGTTIAFLAAQQPAYAERLASLAPALPEQKVLVLYPTDLADAFGALLLNKAGQTAVKVLDVEITITWANLVGCHLDGFFPFSWWDEDLQNFKSTLINASVEDKQNQCNFGHFARLFTQLANNLVKVGSGLSAVAYFKFIAPLAMELQVLAVKFLAAGR